MSAKIDPFIIKVPDPLARFFNCTKEERERLIQENARQLSKAVRKRGVRPSR